MSGPMTTSERLDCDRERAEYALECERDKVERLRSELQDGIDALKDVRRYVCEMLDDKVKEMENVLKRTN